MCEGQDECVCGGGGGGESVSVCGEVCSSFTSKLVDLIS